MHRVVSPLRRRLLTAVGVAVSTGLLMLSSVPPASAGGPTASIVPSTGLVDLQVVTVTGSGFPPNTRIEIMECAGTVQKPPKDNSTCQGETVDNRAETDAKGSFVNEPHDPSGHTFGYQILRLPRPRFARFVVCDLTHPCGLFVGEDETDFTQPHTFVPFQFRGETAAAGQTSSSGSDGGAIAAAAAVVVVLVAAALLLVMRRRSRSTVAGS